MSEIKKIEIKIKGLKESKKFAKLLTSNFFPGFVIGFSGQLGAGKTTLTQFIASYLKIKDKVKSPTFNILKTYQGKKHELTHIDAYRLENYNKDQLGLLEYIESDGVSIIEWYENIIKILPNQYLVINISLVDETTRLLEIYSSSDKYNNVIEEIKRKWK